MAIAILILLAFVGFVSSIAGACVTYKRWSDSARRRFFALFIALAILTFALTIWNAILAHQSGEKSTKDLLGDPEHAPFVAVISLPGSTRFVRTNSSDFPSYGTVIQMYDGTHRTTPLRSYPSQDIAAHTAILDEKPWLAEDDASEHRFTVSISTRTGLASEELILRRAGNDQWMSALRVRQGMRTLDEHVDSAWPRDQGGQIDWHQ